MKRVLMIILAIILSLTGCTQTDDTQSDKPVVYTTIYPLYALAQPIAGDLVDLRMALPMGADPHDFEPSAKLIGAMQAADAIIYNGVGMEPWIDDILSGASNEQLIVKRGEDVVELLALVDDHAHNDEDNDADDDHDHAGNIDPHIWLDPVNAKALSEMIYQTLGEVVGDEQSAQLTENYQRVIDRLDALDQQYQHTLADLSKREIVVGHAAFGYLCHRYRLSQISIAGLSTLEEPSAALLAEITEIAKEHQVNTIFYDGTGSAKLAEVIATEIGVTTAPLYPLGTLSTQMIENGDDYFTVMKQNLNALKSALSE